MSPNEIDSITHHSGPVTIDVAEAPAEYLELTVDTGMLFIVEEAVESVDVPFSTKTVQLRRRKSPPLPASEHVALTTPVPRVWRWRVRRFIAATVPIVACSIGAFGIGWAVSLWLFSGWFE